MGHGPAKKALLLGLIAEQSVLLVGPPGSGKSTLARAALALAGERARERDLAGPAPLEIEEGVHAHATGVLRVARAVPSRPEPGATVLVEGIDQATPEVVARLCGELDHGLRAIVVAARRASLPGALLDRLAIHSTIEGLAERPDRRVIGSARTAASIGAVAAHATIALESARRAARVLEVPSHLVDRVASIAAVAAAQGDGCRSDRRWSAFAATLRASAVLRGGVRVEASDLASLVAVGLLPPDGLGEHAARPTSASPARATHGPPSASSGSGSRVSDAAGAGDPDALGGHAAARTPIPEAPRTRECELPRAGSHRASARPDAAVAALVRAIEGSLEGGHASNRDDPAGAPRRAARLRDLSEWETADPADWLRFVDGEAGDVPRVLRRQRRSRGGAFAVLRDVSASMEGSRAAFCSEVIERLFAAVARRGLRVGYAEFHHDVEVFVRRGRFLHRDVAALLERARTRRAQGGTSYAAPLAAALQRLPRAPGGRPPHLFFLTDGLPVLGDPSVRAERALAAARGVVVHTLFVGYGSPPPVLVALAAETGGLAFQARPRPGGRAILAPLPTVRASRGIEGRAPRGHDASERA